MRLIAPFCRTRRPMTTSASPKARRATTRGMASAAYVPSASSMTTNWPRKRSRPLRRALPLPGLRSVMTVAPQARAMAAVASCELPSRTTTSLSNPMVRRVAMGSERRVRPMAASSFLAGRTMVTSRRGLPEAGVALAWADAAATGATGIMGSALHGVRGQGHRLVPAPRVDRGPRRRLQERRVPLRVLLGQQRVGHDDDGAALLLEHADDVGALLAVGEEVLLVPHARRVLRRGGQDQL